MSTTLVPDSRSSHSFLWREISQAFRTQQDLRRRTLVELFKGLGPQRPLSIEGSLSAKYTSHTTVNFLGWKLIMSDNYGIPNPQAANLSELTQQQVVCYINQSSNEYNGNLGARVSSIFVIGIISTFVTFFPVLARRSARFHVPLYVYLFARYFGAGVIVATAFIHLLDPAYGEIGPQTCVGLTGGWAVYSWPPAIVLTSIVCLNPNTVSVTKKFCPGTRQSRLDLLFMHSFKLLSAPAQVLTCV